MVSVRFTNVQILACVSRAEVMKEYSHRSRKFQHFIDSAITTTQGRRQRRVGGFFNATYKHNDGYWPNKLYELLTVTKGEITAFDVFVRG